MIDEHTLSLTHQAREAQTLRDRYGYPLSDADVLEILQLIKDNPDNEEAAETIGIKGALGDNRLAMGYDMLTDEEYELELVENLRPIANLL